MNEVTDTGVELHDWDDINDRRSAIYKETMDAFKKQFPSTYNGVTLHVDDLHYEGPESVDLPEQKKALLQNRYLHRKLKGTVTLKDATTGQVLDTQPSLTLMRVPMLTDRGTFVHNGNEYTTMNQMRLLSGVYARRKASGELESHFNAERGSGSSFRIRLEPETGLFKLDIGQASLKLYPLLQSLGVPDERLAATWGADVLAKNKEKPDARVFDKAYQRLVRKPDPNATPEAKREAILAALEGTKLNVGVVARTLPNLFNNKVASAWRSEVPPLELPELGAPADGEDGGDEEFSRADWMELAKFLNDTAHAGIPLDAPVPQIVEAVKAFLGSAEPGINAQLLEQAQAMPLEAVA